jgi:E3 UFM1-protein ligase 1
VTENINKLQAELVGNQLITTEYTLLKKAKILGFLSAISNPLNVDSFLKVTGIENRNIEEIINELISEGKLKGRYQNGYFVPDKFTVNQKRIITQFYQNNGYVDAETLQRKFLVSRP